MIAFVGGPAILSIGMNVEKYRNSKLTPLDSTGHDIS